MRNGISNGTTVTPPAANPTSSNTAKDSPVEIDAEPQQSPRRSATGKAGRAFGILFLLICVAAAFYGGMRYKEVTGGSDASTSQILPATPALSPNPESTQSSYEQRRREIDRAPAAEARKMAAENNGQPLASDDPEFLYLYGRALLLSGQPDEALQAFNLAIKKVEEKAPAGRDPLKVEARIATVAAALKSKDREAGMSAAEALNDVIEKDNSMSTSEAPATSAPSPQE